MATFVRSTGGRASASTSASGSSVRRCSATQNASTARPAPISTRVRVLVQPTLCACEIAISGSTRPTASTSAPRMSSRAGILIGDSGTSSSVAIAAPRPIAAPSQKIQWYET